MERIRNAVQTFETLEAKYELPMENIQSLSDQMDHFKVFVPLIGRFSAGKSALINMVLNLGQEICKEDISPQTALPAEISYAEEERYIVVKGSEKREISDEEFFQYKDEITGENADLVKLYLHNENLSRFPDIALVDMPGLDSGYEVHDKAIHDYIQNSMAYVLVFPGDDLTIPKSMEPILYELNTHNMPMCVVITKGNRIASNEEEQKENLIHSLRKYYPEQEIPVFVTETEEGRVEEFIEYLESLQSKAMELGAAFYQKKLEPEFTKISNYLCGQLKSMDMTMSQLEEQKDALEGEITELAQTVDSEMTRFEKQIPQLVQEIAGDVQAALSEHLEEYVFNLIHETDISSSIQETVRNAMERSYEEHVVGEMKKHLEKISNSMSMGSANAAATLAIDVDKVCGKEISGVSRAVIDVAAVILTGGGILGGIIADAVIKFLNRKNQEKREEAERKVRQGLTENVFPSIDREITNQLEINLHQVLEEVRASVKKDVDEQIGVRKKALEDVIRQKELQDTQREEKRQEITQDQEVIEGEWRMICE